MPTVVLDTNILVAAGFASGSASARLVEAVRGGELGMVWNDATRRETQRILKRIPPLDWGDVEGLYRDADRFDDPTRPGDFAELLDGPVDREFAALAQAAGAVLVTNDDDFLAVRDRLAAKVMTPGEFVRKRLQE